MSDLGRICVSRDLLVIAEVALTLVLLSTAGLVLKSFANARSLGLGFDPHLLLSARVDLPSPSLCRSEKLPFFRSATENLLGAARRAERRDRLEPTPQDGMAKPLLPEGMPEPEPGKMPAAEMAVVTAGLQTLKRRCCAAGHLKRVTTKRFGHITIDQLIAIS